MKIIQGISRHQMQFTSLDDLIAIDNPVRIIDAFVEKPDIVKLGIQHQPTGKQRSPKTNPGGAPRYDDKLLLKLYLYGYSLLAQQIQFIQELYIQPEKIF